MEENNLQPGDPNQAPLEAPKPSHKKLYIVIALLILAGIGAYLLGASSLFKGALIESDKNPLAKLQEQYLKINPTIEEGLEINSNYTIKNLSTEDISIWFDEGIEAEVVEVKTNRSCMDALQVETEEPQREVRQEQTQEPIQNTIQEPAQEMRVETSNPNENTVVETPTENHCGNGVVEPELGETCYGDAWCNKQCERNKCGDFEILVGKEQCDDGPEGSATCFGIGSDNQCQFKSIEPSTLLPIKSSLLNPLNHQDSTNTIPQSESLNIRSNVFEALSPRVTHESVPRNATVLSQCQYVELKIGRVPGVDAVNVRIGSKSQAEIDILGEDEPKVETAKTFRQCGNKIKEPGEYCDDAIQNGIPGRCNASCTGIVPVGERLSEKRETKDPVINNRSTTPQCGNSVLDPGETCDDGMLVNGTPGKCNRECTAILADRKSPTEPLTECNDGKDNDGDGKIDLKDAGCIDALDDDEENHQEVITKKASAKEVVSKYETAGFSCLDKVKYIKYKDLKNTNLSEDVIETIYLLSQLANEKRAIVIGYDDDGDRVFKADTNIRRDEAAKIAYVGTCFESFLDATNNLKLKSAGYKDISSKDWSEDIINAMSNADIIGGYGDNRFHPEQNVTRAEFVKILVDIYLLENPKAKFTKYDAKKYDFWDVDEKDWHKDYMTTAFELGIIKGFKHQGQYVLNPDFDLTRSEAAVLMNNFLANTLDLDFSDL